MKKALISLLLGITLVGGLVGCGEKTVSKVEYDKVVESNEQLTENNKELIEDKQELQNELDKAKDYLELDPTEKELVDAKIVEVNQATEDQLAQEKAQKEAEESTKKQAEEEAKRKAEEEEKARKEEEERQKAEAEAHKYETGLTWEQIAREGKNGTLGQFEGKIVQVINGNYGYTQYRIAINGNYDTIVLVEAASYELKETLLEDDYVYFKGKSMGTVSYESVLGTKITIPAFDVDEIHR